MKGAIGNAFIMNMVITFILIFYILLIGSMAYSKAYKIRNYILNYVVSNKSSKPKEIEFTDEFNTALRKYGYTLANDSHCPSEKNGYTELIHDTSAGSYDFCVYYREYYTDFDRRMVDKRYSYLVITYMKFDFPIIGEFLKLPLVGESQTINMYK